MLRHLWNILTTLYCIWGVTVELCVWSNSYTCSSKHVTTHVTQLFSFTEVTKQIYIFFCFFPLEQMKKGKPNTGTMNEAHSMENVFDHFVKDVPQGPTPGAKSKEKPGRNQP